MRNRQIHLRLDPTWDTALTRYAQQQQAADPARRWHSDGVSDVVRGWLWEKLTELGLLNGGNDDHRMNEEEDNLKQHNA